MKALRSVLIAVALVAAASPASAQWTRVTEVPVVEVHSVWAKGDTIAAGADTVAYVSTNGGVTWKRSAKVAVGVTSVEAVRIRNHRLFAGTAGQGVFISDDLGDTWTAFNQNLVGGIGNSQLFIQDMLVRGDSLYIATSGAGPWVRNLVSGTWTRFGNALEVNQSANMNAITAGGGGRLFASAGFNGNVFFRDPGQTDWTLSWLNNVGAVPGLAALTAIWTGSLWVVGSNVGVFLSPTGEEPWDFVDVGLGTPLLGVSFAQRGPDLFAAFGPGPSTAIEYSRDVFTWQLLDDLPATFLFGLAVQGGTLYAARVDGLWRRSIANVAVPAPVPARLRFSIAGRQPVRDDVRFRFELAEAGRAVIDVFDVTGRRAASVIDEALPAGPHEVGWSGRGLAPGIYAARLKTADASEVVRLVRVR